MGAKTKVQNVSTQTPLQQALMNQRLQDVMFQLKGMPNLGEAWGGAKPSSYQPIPSSAPVAAKPAAAQTNPLAKILEEFSYRFRDKYTNSFTNPFRNNMG